MRRSELECSEPPRVMSPDLSAPVLDPEEEITRSFPHPPIRPLALPKEIPKLSGILGLREGVDWDTIHRRYRQLAKQFHPDLHPEVTGRGKRFMMYDAAYRKLVTVKTRYLT